MRGHRVPLNRSVFLKKGHFEGLLGRLYKINEEQTVRQHYLSLLCRAQIHSFSYEGRRSEAEQTQNTEQLLQLCHCRPASWAEVLDLEGTLAFLRPLWSNCHSTMHTPCCPFAACQNQRRQMALPSCNLPVSEATGLRGELVPAQCLQTVLATHASAEGGLECLCSTFHKKASTQLAGELPYFWDTNRAWGFEPQHSSPHQTFQAPFK